MNECILRMKGISKSFSGVKVLDDVEFNVRSGTVHSLMGENGAGKSTLMKCLFGIYQKDAGEIYLDNKLINFADPKHALEHGVSMVHQELNQVIQRSISDNIWLGRYPKKGLFIDEKKMKKDTIELFEKIEIEIDPNTPLHKLSVAQRQMVEITKAISYNAKVIVFDEPTSSLTDKEVTMLFKIIQKLKTQGVGIVYISHKMDEIFQISDDVTVLRDGKYIGTDNVANLNIDKVVNMMVGRNLEQRFPEKTNIPGEVHLSVKNISTKYEPRIHDISFDLRRGEILGIAGLVGAGRTELIESIFGVRTKESGEIYLDGSQIIESACV